MIAFGLIRARFAEKIAEFPRGPSNDARSQRATRAIRPNPPFRNHNRRGLETCHSPSAPNDAPVVPKPEPHDARDLVPAAASLRVCVATSKFKTALETDVCSCPQGFNGVKELAAIGSGCEAAANGGGVCGLSVRLI